MTHSDLVALEHAATPFEAKVIAAVLAEAGIPAYIDGELLSDEFAAAQRLMNLRGTSIMVPAQAVEQARAALAEARASGRETADEAEAADRDETPIERSKGSVWTVLFAVGFFISTIGWIGSTRAGDNDPLFDYEYRSNGVVTTLKSTGQIRWTNLDQNGDGVYEESTSYDRNGRELDRQFDRDADGFAERLTLLAPNGDVAEEGLDTDKDGRMDRWIRPDPDKSRGWRSVWTDPDGDGQFDRREIQRRDGSTVLVEFDRFEKGFVREN